MDAVSPEHLRITQQRWTAIMEMLVSKGYVDGMDVKRSADGEVIISENGIRITLDGLSYLQENSLMHKAAEAAKGIAGVIG